MNIHQQLIQCPAALTMHQRSISTGPLFLETEMAGSKKGKKRKKDPDLYEGEVSPQQRYCRVGHLVSTYDLVITS